MTGEPRSTRTGRKRVWKCERKHKRGRNDANALGASRKNVQNYLIGTLHDVPNKRVRLGVTFRLSSSARFFPLASSAFLICKRVLSSVRAFQTHFCPRSPRPGNQKSESFQSFLFHSFVRSPVSIDVLLSFDWMSTLSCSCRNRRERKAVLVLVLDLDLDLLSLVQRWCGCGCACGSQSQIERWCDKKCSNKCFHVFSLHIISPDVD